MARTHRKVPHWAEGEDYDEKFKQKIKCGHVKFPIKHNTDGYLYEDVWTAEGKRFVKKLRSKHARRQGKQELLPEEES
jgi:hypothetical protein